jgi:hypothetical protein
MPATTPSLASLNQRVGGSIPSRRTNLLVMSILQSSLCESLPVNSRKSMARKSARSTEPAVDLGRYRRKVSHVRGEPDRDRPWPDESRRSPGSPPHAIVCPLLAIAVMTARCVPTTVWAVRRRSRRGGLLLHLATRSPSLDAMRGTRAAQLDHHPAGPRPAASSSSARRDAAANGNFTWAILG